MAAASRRAVAECTSARKVPSQAKNFTMRFASCRREASFHFFFFFLSRMGMRACVMPGWLRQRCDSYSQRVSLCVEVDHQALNCAGRLKRLRNAHAQRRQNRNDSRRRQWECLELFTFCPFLVLFPRNLSFVPFCFLLDVPSPLTLAVLTSFHPTFFSCIVNEFCSSTRAFAHTVLPFLQLPLLHSTSRSPLVHHLSSVAGIVPAPTRCLYAATKAAGLAGFRTAAWEQVGTDRDQDSALEQDGNGKQKKKKKEVRFVSILPGTIDTDFRRKSSSAVSKGIAPAEGFDSKTLSVEDSESLRAPWTLFAQSSVPSADAKVPCDYSSCFDSHRMHHAPLLSSRRRSTRHPPSYRRYPLAHPPVRDSTTERTRVVAGNALSIRGVHVGYAVEWDGEKAGEEEVWVAVRSRRASK